MLPSLQTHFNAPVDLDTLRQIRAFGFRWARIDAQTSTADTINTMIADALACSLTPLPIVYDLDRLYALPPGLDVEWGNEPDGDIRPTDYRARLNDATLMALDRGLRLWAPALSNLDRDSLRWLHLVRYVGGDKWPEGLHGISVHRYGDGTFDYAHEGFASRDAEVDRLLELCAGLPYIVTEFGYPTTPVDTWGRRARAQRRAQYLRYDLRLTEDQQAENIAKEWDFWRSRGCDVPFLFQMNDGTRPDESYGIRRCSPSGTLLDWKPAAYQVPQEDTPMENKANVSANTVFAREDLIEVPDRAGDYGVRWPPGAETILSPSTSGNHELRPMTALGGPNETCQIVGDLVYFPMNSGGGRFAWRLADK